MYNDRHIYYNYLEDYDEYYVFEQFLFDERLFKNLIKPQMYQKALSDFVANGKFTTFPTKYVYQWMGVLMRNTAILRACTSIAGHSMGYPIDDFVDIFFEGNMESFEEYAKTLKNKGTFSPEFGWMENYEDEGEELSNVDRYNAYSQFLEDKGFWDWLILPDGSGAYSDYGIRPLEELIAQYTEDSTPEETIVLINKILDVTHQNGDLALAFIEGGQSTLTQISNKGYVNENIKAYHGSPCKDIVTGKFKRGKTGYLGPGIYFSEDKDYTIRYAKKYVEGAIYEVEINLLNPLVLTGDNPTKDFLTAIYGTESVYLRREKKQSNICYLIESKDIKKFLSMGYDGVIWDFAGNKEYVLYDNSNITIINKEEVLQESVESNKVYSKRNIKKYIKMKPTNEEIKYYKEIFKQMFDFIKKYFNRKDLKYPSIVLNYIKQNDDMFIKTGYYNPITQQIVLFMDGRHKKDIGRSFFHECCHYIQDIDGIIDESGYTGDKITEDKNLVKLEEEAYLKGNMAFRSWTEEEQKKGKLK
jgi:hypothetical protein